MQIMNTNLSTAPTLARCIYLSTDGLRLCVPGSGVLESLSMTTTVTLEDDSDEPSMTVELSVNAVSVLLTIERLN